MLQHAYHLFGEGGVADRASGAQPCERPVDHAEQGHGNGHLVARVHARGVGPAQETPHGSDHVALAVENDLALLDRQELRAAEQRRMPRGGGFILTQKSAHQLVQRGAVIQRLALGPGLRLADDEQQLLRVPIQEIEKDGFLAAVVMIEPRLGGATGRSDIVHAGGRVALLREAGRRDIEDLIPALVV